MSSLTLLGTSRTSQTAQYTPGVTSASPRTNERDLSQNTVGYVRVEKVVLSKNDITDLEWRSKGYGNALYGIYYRAIQSKFSINKQLGGSEYSSLEFAYCMQNQFKRIPVVGEIVTICRCLSENSQEGDSTSLKTYWKDIVPIWNTINSNFAADSSENGMEFKDPFFKESKNILPIQLFPGDVSLEGRYGQSIRFGGTQYRGNYSEMVDENNSGKPYTIIRNGQGDLSRIFHTSDNSIDITVSEDINEDNSSIYLLSDHDPNLNLANNKLSVWKDRDSFLEHYRGSQVLINSDRVQLNARTDSVGITASDKIFLSSDRVGIGAESYISVNAPKVYLGDGEPNEKEPALLGDKTVKWLEDLCLTVLEPLLTALSTNPIGDPKVWGASVAAQSVVLSQELSGLLRHNLPGLKSKQIFLK